MNQTPVIIVEFKEPLLHNGYTVWMDKFHNLTELLKTKNTHCASCVKLNVQYIQPCWWPRGLGVGLWPPLAGSACFNPTEGMNVCLL
jgi:hypothetical protein